MARGVGGGASWEGKLAGRRVGSDTVAGAISRPGTVPQRRAKRCAKARGASGTASDRCRDGCRQGTGVARPSREPPWALPGSVWVAPPGGCPASHPPGSCHGHPGPLRRLHRIPVAPSPSASALCPSAYEVEAYGVGVEGILPVAPGSEVEDQLPPRNPEAPPLERLLRGSPLTGRVHP